VGGASRPVSSHAPGSLCVHLPPSRASPTYALSRTHAAVQALLSHMPSLAPTLQCRLSSPTRPLSHPRCRLPSLTSLHAASLCHSQVCVRAHHDAWIVLRRNRGRELHAILEKAGDTLMECHNLMQWFSERSFGGIFNVD
jgi:hypothetical protein